MPGYFYETTQIKEDATPIDNVTKFAWYDDDYETVELWHEYTEEELARFDVGRKEREFVENGPDVQAAQDAAICELYETQMDMQDSLDAAICEMYELSIGGME